MSVKSRSFEGREKRKCRAKKAFKTVKDMGIAIAVSAINQRRLFTGYACPWCKKYHMSHQYVDIDTDQYGVAMEGSS